jgi:hypothetical protein
MSELKSNQDIKLGYDNWHIWDRQIKSTIRRKNTYIAFDPEPTDPRNPKQVIPPTTSTSSSMPSMTVTSQPSKEELQTYREELKEWKTAINVAAGVILGTISDEVQHVIDPEDPVNVMYNKLKAEVVKQSSGSSANGTRIELVYKQFKDELTMENFEKHLTFCRSKSATLNAVGAGFDDSFLAWLLLNSLSSSDNPIWSMESTNIVTSGVPTNQWSFNHISGKLREALCNNIRPTERASSSGNQAALNGTASKTNQNHYNGPPCTYSNCCRPKSHATEDCRTKRKEERDKANKKKHKAKRRREDRLKVAQNRRAQAPIRTRNLTKNDVTTPTDPT